MNGAIAQGDIAWIDGYIAQEGVGILLDPEIGALQHAFSKNRRCAAHMVMLIKQAYDDMEERIQQTPRGAPGALSPRRNVMQNVKHAPQQTPSKGVDQLTLMATRVRAVQLIKRSMGRIVARIRARQAMVRKVWNELDQMEESELAESNAQYEKLKGTYDARKRGESAMKLKWECKYDPGSGNVYFRNSENGETSWDCPEEFRDSLQEEDCWTLHTDPASGRVFFSNKLTKEVTWKCPPELKHQDNSKLSFEAGFLKRVDAAREELTMLKDVECDHMSDIFLGPKDPVDHAFVTNLLREAQSGKRLNWTVAIELASRAFPLLLHLDNVVELHTKHGSGKDAVQGRIVVIGDIHGQLDDLSMILHNYGFPSEENQLLFNGDIVDRGQQSVECLLVILCLKIAYPDHLHINRGNHEAKDVNSRDGFEGELQNKYGGNAIFDLFSELLATLPLAHTINKKIFVVHAGLFRKDHVTLDQLQSYRRLHVIPPRDSLMEDMLWSDPMDRQLGREESFRGAGIRFGRDIAEKFMKENHLKMIIRSHECVDNGFQEFWDGKLFTIFSASNYCGEVGNWGAVAEIRSDMKPVFCRYSTLHPEQSQISLPPDQALTVPDGPTHVKEKVRSRKLEDSVVRKLLTRVTIHRPELLKVYEHRVHTMEKGKGHVHGEVPRQVWSQVLKEVLRLDVPFIQFQHEMLGHSNTTVAPLVWLDRFKPMHVHLASKTADLGAGHNQTAREGLLRLVEEMSTVLFNKKTEMQSLFRYFDEDGNGTVSRDEFRNGLTSLLSVLKMEEDYSEEMVDQILELVDKDHNGEIDYQEFLAAFQFVKPK